VTADLPLAGIIREPRKMPDERSMTVRTLARRHVGNILSKLSKLRLAAFE
jgi:hypothetical protein